MRNTLIVCSLVIMLVQQLPAQSNEEVVLNLSRRKFSWLINQQSDSLQAILDDRVLYIHSNGWAQTRQEILDDMNSGKLIYKKVDVQDAKVRLYDKTAIVNGTGRFSGVREGHEFDMTLSYTEVYVLRKKKWMLVTRHANRLP